MFKTRSPVPFIIILAIVAIVAVVLIFVVPALGGADVTSTGDSMTWSWHVDFRRPGKEPQIRDAAPASHTNAGPGLRAEGREGRAVRRR